jgi:hypothetical protein
MSVLLCRMVLCSDLAVLNTIANPQPETQAVDWLMDTEFPNRDFFQNAPSSFQGHTK